MTVKLLAVYSASTLSEERLATQAVIERHAFSCHCEEPKSTKQSRGLTGEGHLMEVTPFIPLILMGILKDRMLALAGGNTLTALGTGLNNSKIKAKKSKWQIKQ
jgi:hypothetical protein